MTEKYSDAVCRWLSEMEFSHCFFVAGGNIMHFLESASRHFECIPVVHEVTAGIAAEYFNATSVDGRKAFALVTAGPGLTNVVTAISGAYLESRELLVIGGQVKSSDLKSPHLRQRGIQEVDGVAIAAPVAKVAQRVEHPIPRSEFGELIAASWTDRKGPVFIEFCLDAQGAPYAEEDSDPMVGAPEPVDLASSLQLNAEARTSMVALLEASNRPVLLLGGGLSREAAKRLWPCLEQLGIPIATSWNAADRVPYDHPLNFGRPDTWGMRWANILLQQSDLVIAVGAKLSLQQTGFNWQSFAPLARVVHVDIDPEELAKDHPHKDLVILSDAEAFLASLCEVNDRQLDRFDEWVQFGQEVKGILPVDEECNLTTEGYVSPYTFCVELGRSLGSEDVVVPCSSGGASTVMMQAFPQQAGQMIINNKALASMGYGLAGAIGAALANPKRRVILTEGDGGFAQNLQDLGTVAQQKLPIKMFIFCNEGYASIRMTQRNYFGGNYVGCDRATGLGLPDWYRLFSAYGIPCFNVPADPQERGSMWSLLERGGPAAFLVPVDPEQTYYPKISSRVTDQGQMESAPLHEMTPHLAEDLTSRVLRYLEGKK